MPFQSEKQRRYLHANHPEIAKRWEREYSDGGIAALNAQLNQLPEYYLPRADGGITRLNYIYGGISHPDGRRGFPGGAGTPGGYQGDWGGSSGGDEGEGDHAQKIRAQNLQAQIDAEKLNKQRAEAVKTTVVDNTTNDIVPKEIFPKTKKFVEDTIVKPIKKIPKTLKHWSQEPINRLMKKQLTKQRIEYLENLYKTKDVSSFPPEIQNLIKEGKLHTDDALQLLDKDNKFGHYKLTEKYNPTQITKGDLSGFHLMSKPKDLIDPKTGELFTNTGWDIFKQEVIQRRGLTTGQGNDREFRPPPEFRKTPKLSPIHKPVSELEQGYEGWIADNPDAYPGVGTWALIEVILPDGTPRTFSGSAEANAFAKYLESIGSEPYTVVTHETEIGKLAKGGIANHFKKRVKLQDSVESLSDVEFKTMYPDWDPEQFTREEYLQFKSETEGNGILDLGQEDETTELVSSTETDEIIPDLLAPGSAAGILAADGGRIGFFTGMREQEQKAKAASSSSGNGGYQNVHQTGAVTQTPGRRKSTTTRSDGPRPHEDETEESMKDALRRAELKKMANTYEDEWGKWDDKYDKLNKYSYTGSGVTKRAKLTDKNYNEDRAVLEKQFGKSIIKKIALAFLGMPISIGYGDIKALKSMYDLEKKYKTDMQKLKDISIDKGWAKHHHAVDTPMQTIEQLMMDTIRVREDDDTKGDEGPIPIIKPITLEVDDQYAQGYGMSDLDRIRANQAKRSMLVEKGIIEEDIFEANSGGLANLFRVKN